MSNQRPIFNSGLYGKANRTVMNAFMDSADTLAANQSAIDYAYRASMPEPMQSRTFLARITTASSLIGGAQWSYSGTEAVMLNATPWVESVSGTGNTFSGAMNLRELFNTGSTYIDGMSLASPSATVGPVGSHWDGTAWTTGSLEAVTIMTVSVCKNGIVTYYFDRPNPMRCS